MKIEVSTLIDAPKDAVWDAITDFEHCHERISGITEAKVLERPESGLVGLRWTETREMFGKPATETMWITDCQPGESYTTRAENCGAVYISQMRVSPSDGRTLLSMSFSGESDSVIGRVMSSVMGAFMKKSVTRMMQQDLEDIKASVEASETEAS